MSNTSLVLLCVGVFVFGMFFEVQKKNMKEFRQRLAGFRVAQAFFKDLNYKVFQVLKGKPADVIVVEFDKAALTCLTFDYGLKECIDRFHDEYAHLLPDPSDIKNNCLRKPITWFGPVGDPGVIHYDNTLKLLSNVSDTTHEYSSKNDVVTVGGIARIYTSYKKPVVRVELVMNDAADSKDALQQLSKKPNLDGLVKATDHGLSFTVFHPGVKPDNKASAILRLPIVALTQQAVECISQLENDPTLGESPMTVDIYRSCRRLCLQFERGNHVVLVSDHRAYLSNVDDFENQRPISLYSELSSLYDGKVPGTDNGHYKDTENKSKIIDWFYSEPTA